MRTEKIHERTELERDEGVSAGTSRWWGKKQFHTLLEHLSVGVVVHGADSKILYSNLAASKLLGLSKAQLLGKKDTDPRWKFLKEDGSEMPIEEFPVNQVRRKLVPVHHLVVGVQRPDHDQPLWVMCNAHPAFGSKNELMQVVVNFTNITLEKKLKEELSEVSSLFQAAMDQSIATIAIVDNNLEKLQYLNRAGREMRGITTAEAATQKISEWKTYYLDGKECRFEDTPIYKAIREGKSSTAELMFRRPDGKEVVVLVNSAPVLKTDGKIMAGISVAMDMTSQFQLKKELEKAKEIAEKAVQTKSQFLDVAAHELRTPVTAISLLLQVTQRSLSKGIPVDQTVLDRLRFQGERLSRLVVELLDVSRLERGIVALKLESSDLVELISESVEELKMRVPHRLVSWIKSREPVLISMDRLRIYQVLSNLLDNANKYSSSDKAIEVRLERVEGKVRVLIEDFGPGISEKLQQELFNPLTRGQSEHEERTSGLGLGLYISRKIIELHLGKIGVISTVGQGSVFYFELPEVNLK